jgi:hypothetical protein
MQLRRPHRHSIYSSYRTLTPLSYLLLAGNHLGEEAAGTGAERDFGGGDERAPPAERVQGERAEWTQDRAAGAGTEIRGKYMNVNDRSESDRRTSACKKESSSLLVRNS